MFSTVDAVSMGIRKGPVAELLIPRVVIALLLTITLIRTVAADSVIRVLGIDEGGRVSLEWSGLGGGSYSIQTSSDLLDWTNAFTGTANGGILSFLDLAEGHARRFYRGTKALAPLEVASQLDTNRIVSMVVSPTKGGTMSLKGVGGIVYNFSVGPGNVFAPVLLKMCLVTNVVGFPTTNSAPAVVQFSPDGFQFPGAGNLEILFPTNIPASAVGSFAFGSVGADFHFIPEVVSNNAVRIPVTHFSTVGTAVWLERDRIAAEARTATESLNSVIDQASEEISAGLNEIRKEQDAGGDANELGDRFNALLETGRNKVATEAIAPLVNVARSDCALASSLSTVILGMGRQLEMLGGTNSGTSGFLTSEYFTSWECNCLNEALTNCAAGITSTADTVDRVLRLEQMNQLFGKTDDQLFKECGGGSAAEFIHRLSEEPCLPKWFGQVLYSEQHFGSQLQPDNDGNGGYTEFVTDEGDEAVLFLIDAEVVQEFHQHFPGFDFDSVSWKLIFKGTMFSTLADSKNIYSPGCGSSHEEDHSNASGQGEIAMQLEFTIENGLMSNFSFHETNSFSAQVQLAGVSTTKITETPCGGDPSEHDSSSPFTASSSARGLTASQDFLNLPGTATNKIVGAISKTIANSVPIKYQWDFAIYYGPQ